MRLKGPEGRPEGGASRSRAAQSASPGASAWSTTLAAETTRVRHERSRPVKERGSPAVGHARSRRSILPTEWPGESGSVPPTAAVEELYTRNRSQGKTCSRSGTEAAANPSTAGSKRTSRAASRTERVEPLPDLDASVGNVLVAAPGRGEVQRRAERKSSVRERSQAPAEPPVAPCKRPITRQMIVYASGDGAGGTGGERSGRLTWPEVTETIPESRPRPARGTTSPPTHRGRSTRRRARPKSGAAPVARLRSNG